MSFSVRYVLSFIFILKGSLVLAECEPCQAQTKAARTYVEYYNEYFTNLDENADMDEVIDNLILMRQTIMSDGLECPSIKQLCRDILQHLFGQTVSSENEMLREFVERVEKREVELMGFYVRPQIDFVRKHEALP